MQPPTHNGRPPEGTAVISSTPVLERPGSPPTQNRDLKKARRISFEEGSLRREEPTDIEVVEGMKTGNAGNMASQSFYGADDIEVRDEDCVIDDSGPITMIKFSDRVHDQIDQSMNQNNADYVKALTEGPWTIYGSYLTVQQGLNRWPKPNTNESSKFMCDPAKTQTRADLGFPKNLVSHAKPRPSAPQLSPCENPRVPRLTRSLSPVISTPVPDPLGARKAHTTGNYVVTKGRFKGANPSLTVTDSRIRHIFVTVENGDSAPLSALSTVIPLNCGRDGPLPASFSISEKHPSQILAWVRLHGLPYINYSKSLFRRIADAVGKVVRVDYNTQTGGSCTLNAVTTVVVDVVVAILLVTRHRNCLQLAVGIAWDFSVGILANSANSDEMANQKKEEEENPPMLVQGPACNASNMLAGWHTFNTSPFAGKSSAYIDGRATVLPRMLEWSGFVLNSRLLWKDGDKPDWIKGVDTLDGDIENPLSLNKDPSVVEPVGSFGRQVLLCWHRAEARTDSKFPPRPTFGDHRSVKTHSMPDTPHELPANGNPVIDLQEPTAKHTSKTRTSRSKRPRKITHDEAKADRRTEAF
ncbi:putative beta-1,4-xylosyltransferase IRX14H [Hibiscus syriacus]|uniref:Glycosyltransferases n=1 Tax=Hibiscus syriacus TaxID=106335 RepID=A0A6A3B385_HIBSY|nr:putative beta-1,4-xylosyltransferase IRX14H [Hibiscus syriacus]